MFPFAGHCQYALPHSFGIIVCKGTWMNADFLTLFRFISCLYTAPAPHCFQWIIDHGCTRMPLVTEWIWLEISSSIKTHAKAHWNSVPNFEVDFQTDYGHSRTRWVKTYDVSMFWNEHPAIPSISSFSHPFASDFDPQNWLLADVVPSSLRFASRLAGGSDMFRTWCLFDGVIMYA